MTTLSLSTVYRNMIVVLRSKIEVSSEHLYLTKQGDVSKEITQRANILDLFELAQSYYVQTVTGTLTWGHLVKACAGILDKEESEKATFLFLRLAAPQGINIHGGDFTEEVNTLTVTQSWITESCMQDLFFEIMRALKGIEKEIITSSESLGPEFSRFFLYNSKVIQKHVLEQIASLTPKSATGELLYTKLKASEGENCIHVPYERYGLAPAFFFSTKKVSAFSDEPFMARLFANYSDNPQVCEGLREIHHFCKTLKNFSKLYFLYRHHEKVQDIACSFLHHYVTKVKKVSSLKTMTSEEIFHHHVMTASRHPFSNRLYDVLMKTHATNEAKKTSPDYSDLKFDYEIDVKPIEELINEYDTKYKPFFRDYLDQFTNLNKQVKKRALRGHCAESTKKMIRRLSQLDHIFTDFLTHFKGPALDHFLPTKASWDEYLAKLVNFFKVSYVAPKLEASGGVKRSLEKSLSSLELSTQPPVHTIVEACGGAGMPEPAEEIAEHKHEPPEDDFTDASQLFRTAQISRAKELLETINKKPLALDYAERVLRWFNNPDQVLDSDDYRDKSPRIKHKMVKIHAFSTYVDLFVNSDYSAKTTWIHPKTGQPSELYRLAGTLEYEEVVLRGFFEYTICPETNLCYHRCFKEVDSFLDGNGDEDLSRFYDAEYPSLASAVAVKQKKIKLSDGDFFVTKDCLDRMIFSDYESATTITLYKL